MGLKCYRVGFILLLSMAILYTASSSNTELGSSATISTFTSVQATSFSISSSSFTAGDSVNFITDLFNLGNTLLTMQTRVYIYDSSGTLVDTVTYSNTTLAGGESQTLTRSWDSTGRTAGSYTAYANGTSDGNFTNTLNLTFTINAAPTVEGPAPEPIIHSTAHEGGTIYFLGVLPPIEIPLEIEPGSLQLLRYPLYQQIAPGSTLLLYPLIQNPLSRALEVNMSATGLAAALSGETSGFVLSPQQTRSAVFPLQIPSTATAGYYPLDVHLYSELPDISYPFIIEVLNYTEVENRPLIYRDVTLNLDRNVSVVTLTIENRGSRPLELVQVYEELPPGLKTDIRRINFLTQPADILEEEGRIRWDLQNIPPPESRRIIYEIPRLSGDISDYAQWPVAEVVTIRDVHPEVVSLAEFQSPTLFAGEERPISFSIFNSGILSQNVIVTLLPPAGWEVFPAAFSFSLPGRTLDEQIVSLKSQPDLPPGTYTFKLRLHYGTTVTEKLLFVTVAEPLIMVTPPSLYERVLGWIRQNFRSALIVVIGALLVLLVLFSAYKAWRAPRYSEKRVEDVERYKRMME
ncbi:MAG TPA: hypothetical protein VJH24_02105 [Candidatus Bilamarchaeaceae archaeon]|nr:hypothetical protein [Candidatus Bilamarchaeaceae archaeon]